MGNKVSHQKANVVVSLQEGVCRLDTLKVSYRGGGCLRRRREIASFTFPRTAWNCTEGAEVCQAEGGLSVPLATLKKKDGSRTVLLHWTSDKKTRRSTMTLGMLIDNLDFLYFSFYCDGGDPGGAYTRVRYHVRRCREASCPEVCSLPPPLRPLCPPRRPLPSLPRPLSPPRRPLSQPHQFLRSPPPLLPPPPRPMSPPRRPLCQPHQFLRRPPPLLPSPPRPLSPPRRPLCQPHQFLSPLPPLLPSLPRPLSPPRRPLCQPHQFLRRPPPLLPPPPDPFLHHADPCLHHPDSCLHLPAPVSTTPTPASTTQTGNTSAITPAPSDKADGVMTPASNHEALALREPSEAAREPTKKTLRRRIRRSRAAKEPTKKTLRRRTRRSRAAKRPTRHAQCKDAPYTWTDVFLDGTAICAAVVSVVLVYYRCW